MSLSQGDDGTPMLVPVKPAAMSTEFEDVARLGKIKGTKGEVVHAICFENTARRILHSRVFRYRLPQINVVSPVPVLIERDRELIQISDFDRESGALAREPHAPDMTLGEAKSLLNKLLADFDFMSPFDRSRALAAFVVPALVMGGLLGGRAPLDLGESNQSQAGKGYRAKLVAAVFGRRVATVAQRTRGVGSLEEIFSSHLIAGRTFISFDNLRGKLDIPAVESFMTEDTFVARVPYSENVLIDPRRFIIMMTSNRAELTCDLANRASIVRINKRHPGYGFREYAEGDLLAHVRAKNRQFLGAVFSVVRAWHKAGKPRSAGTRHDFRAWAGALDWIVRELLGEAPLLEGHESEKIRVSTPHLNWLRDVAHEVARQDCLGQPLRAHQLLNLLAGADIEIPGVDADADLEDDDSRNRALRGLGARLARCFVREVIEVDRFRVQRTTMTDDNGRQNREYEFTERVPPSYPQDDPVSPLPVSVSSPHSPHALQTFCPLPGEAPGMNPNAPTECSQPMGGIGGNSGNGQKTSGESSNRTCGTTGTNEPIGINPGCPVGEQPPDEIRFANVPEAGGAVDDDWGEI